MPFRSCSFHTIILHSVYSFIQKFPLSLSSLLFRSDFTAYDPPFIFVPTRNCSLLYSLSHFPRFLLSISLSLSIYIYIYIYISLSLSLYLSISLSLALSLCLFCLQFPTPVLKVPFEKFLLHSGLRNAFLFSVTQVSH